MEISINAVAFHDGTRWVAQGLEYDICVSTRSLHDLLRAFKNAVKKNMLVNKELGRTGLEGIAPAPGNFHEMFNAAESYTGQSEKDRKSWFRLSALLAQTGA